MHFLEEVRVDMGVDEAYPSVNENAMADESCGIVESKSGVTMPSSSPYSSEERGLSLALLPPVTPHSNQETSGERPLSSHCNNPLTTSVGTPKDSIFDLFVSDSTKFMVAPPYHDNCSEQFLGHAVRRSLSFELDRDLIRDMMRISDDDCNDEINTEAEEQALFELVSATILGSIVSEENDRVHPELAMQVSSGLDGFRTPDTVPRVSGVAKVCPGAPRKEINLLHRHIDRGVCKKLEF